MTSNESARRLAEYKRAKITSDPWSWFALAKSYHLAAEQLFQIHENSRGDSRPVVFNAAISIELLLKGIIASRGHPVPLDSNGHNLPKLADKAELRLTANERTLLEFLTEMIVWAGRYPTPKSDGQWNNYHDNIFEKITIREQSATTFRTIANPNTFPTWTNYRALWNACAAEFDIDQQ